MPCQSSSTVPSAAHSKTSRRHRSADDQLAVSFSTPRKSPGFSDDNDGDDDNKVKDSTNDDPDVSRPQPNSAKQLPLQQPTTPNRARPKLSREPASDPGALQIDPEAFYSGIRPYQQAGKLPCGHQPYGKPAEKWSQFHIESCSTCFIQKEIDRRVYKKKDVEQLLERASRSPTRRRSIAVEGPHSPSNNDKPSASADNENENKNKNDKAKVESKLVAKKQNRNQVASMVHHRLIQAAKKRLTDHEKAGYLYILHSHEKPGLLKLGCFQRDVSKCVKEHTCVGDFTWAVLGNQVAHVKKAEELARLDLDHLRRN
jgi:hypothetical protein